MPQGVLHNPLHEQFAQLVAVERVNPHEARRAVFAKGRSKGMPTSKGMYTTKALMNNQPIRERIATLQAQVARRSELTYEGIIKEMQEEARLARLAGQHSAAIKALELLGMELHKMFVNRVEVGRAGEFDAMSEEELRAFILNQMKEVGLDGGTLIDGEAIDLTAKAKELPAPVPQTAQHQEPVSDQATVSK